MSDLTTEKHRRQNILNNRYALRAAEQHLGLGGVSFEGATVFTKQQVTLLFDISDATVERYIASHGDELRANGYTLLRGRKLNNFKGLVDVTLTNEGNKAPVVGLFSFRAVLNLAMLLTESERARQVRTRLLDIVMDVLAEKTGGQTKFINQRDDRYLTAAGTIQTDGSVNCLRVLDTVLGLGAFLERTVRPEPVEGQSRKFPNCELQVRESPYFNRIKAFLKKPFAMKVLGSGFRQLTSLARLRLCPSTGSP